jgi:Protein of unknown function (DUF3148)
MLNRYPLPQLQLLLPPPVDHKIMPKEFAIGSPVKMATLPPYIKTADPMPMLRPAQLVPIDSSGTVLEQRPSDHWVVKFERGTFLIGAQYLEADPVHRL